MAKPGTTLRRLISFILASGNAGSVITYHRPQVLTHEEWANGRLHKSLSARRRPPTRHAIPAALDAGKVGIRALVSVV